MREGLRTPLPVIFAGLSISLAHARRLLPGVARGPVRAGDLDLFGPGQVVVIIDGDLAPEAQISPEEIGHAVGRGVRVFGAASVGAWRAACPVTGMKGFGWVYEAYCRGAMIGPDEIAVLYDPLSLRALTVPLVSVRFHLETEVVSGTVPARVAGDALSAIKQLPLTKRNSGTLARTFEDITGIPPPPLVDIKAEDARGVLSHVAASQPALHRVRFEPLVQDEKHARRESGLRTGWEEST
jgi:hypothetical protein